MAVTAASSASPRATAGTGHTYAVVVDGGRQYRVMEGQELEIDFRHAPDGGCKGKRHAPGAQIAVV